MVTTTTIIDPKNAFGQAALKKNVQAAPAFNVTVTFCGSDLSKPLMLTVSKRELKRYNFAVIITNDGKRKELYLQ